jgi:hypothetical protein
VLIPYIAVVVLGVAMAYLFVTQEILRIEGTDLVPEPHMDGTGAITARLEDHDEERAAVEEVAQLVTAVHGHWLLQRLESVVEDDGADGIQPHCHQGNVAVFASSDDEIAAFCSKNASSAESVGSFWLR